MSPLLVKGSDTHWYIFAVVRITARQWSWLSISQGPGRIIPPDPHGLGCHLIGAMCSFWTKHVIAGIPPRAPLSPWHIWNGGCSISLSPWVINMSSIFYTSSNFYGHVAWAKCKHIWDWKVGGICYFITLPTCLILTVTNDMMTWEADLFLSLPKLHSRTLSFLRSIEGK